MLQICNFLKEYELIKENKFCKICEELEKFFKLKQEKMLRGFNDFSFFEVLKGINNENAHSNVIAEFLNPYGSHYQKDLFLKKFFEVVGLEIKDNFEVYREYQLENGRIDILLEGKKNTIIIENKIYASDGERQIERYVIEKQNKNKNLIFLYLNLWGKEPSKKSLGELEIKDNILLKKNKKIANFKIITYENTILPWIRESINEIENISSLRESFKQYEKVIKKLIRKEDYIMNLKNYLMDRKDILIHLIENFEEFKKFIDKDEECKKISEKENLEEVLDNIKQEIRKDVAMEIKKYFEEKYGFLNGYLGETEKRFEKIEKRAYFLFTKKDLKFKYILYFEESGFRLFLGKYKGNCEKLDCIQKEINNNRCKDKKCKDIRDAFDSPKWISHFGKYESGIEFYINYLKNKNNLVKDIIKTIEEKIQSFEISYK